MSDATADPAMEIAVKWAHQYVASCRGVLTAGNACLDVANRAVGARNTAAQRPQHEISIRNFIRMAEQAEDEFIPLFRSFVEACTAARETAGNFLSAQTEHEPEIVLALNVDSEALDEVATTKAILLASYGATPAGFIEGVEEANAIMKNPFPEAGNIYAPPPPTERACPWCAETIKAAAVICRFCGREVEPQADPAPPA